MFLNICSPLLPFCNRHAKGLTGCLPACNAGDPGLIPGSGRSPGRGDGYQQSCLGNPMNRGAWWAAVHGVTKLTRLSD